MGLIDQIRRCRNRGVPLVSVSTTDDHATANAIAEQLEQDSAILVWNAAAGWTARNDPGAAALARMADGADPYDPPPVACLRAASKAPDRVALIVIGAHHWQGQQLPEAWVKAIRDPFEATGRTLILVGPSFASWGPDVGPHVEPLDDDPPTDSDRETAIRSLVSDAGVPDPGDTTIRLAVAGTRGLPRFGVRQAAALAIGPAGLDLERLRARWKKQINSTPGLSVDDTRRSLDDLGGLASIKAFATRLAGGRQKFGAVVLIDEGGKQLAGGAGDTSGVSQSIEAALCTELQDTKADGMIAYGASGSGKSASGVAIGAALAVPVIRLDLGSVKGSLVGQSEGQIRRALSTIRALAGRAFWVLTSNEMVTIKPEIRRRFRAGIWFYDVPFAEERETIRHLYATRYGVTDDPAQWPDLEGWTGAEIETCAERSADWSCSPREAAGWIVPVSQSSAEVLAAMRATAAGRYLSASYPGPYRGPQQQTTAAAGRRFGAGV